MTRRRVAIDIDLNALVANLSVVHQLCQSARVFCVLKADAYGHGAVECARALSSGESTKPADGFAVVFPDEALELREAGIEQPLLVLQGPANLQELRSLSRMNAWQVIHTVEQCRLLEENKEKNRLDIWVKVDTGMGRLGFSRAEFPNILEDLQRIPNVNVLGVLSHLANADVAGNNHTLDQISVFKGIAADMAAVNDSAGCSKPGQNMDLSLANSAAIQIWPRAEYDWVRPGLMLYGANSLEGASPPIPLQPVMEVSTPLIAVKSKSRGDGIGYGQTYTCPEDMPVGYAAIGYGDGLPRSIQNGSVQIRQHTVPIIGRISMDSIALDLRGVGGGLAGGELTAGEPIVLWGTNKPVCELARSANTISYELLCAIKGRRSYQLS